MADSGVYRCRWFLHCTNDAANDVEHPTLGWVPTCDEHIAWLGDNPSPTQFVPPMAAAVSDRHGGIMERLDEKVICLACEDGDHHSCYGTDMVSGSICECECEGEAT